MDLIDIVGLDEEIRCEMCKNPMHTNRGCDGHCKYDEKLYERIIQILDKRITPLPPAQPEREKGEWIVFKAPDEQHCGLVKCPFCGEDMIAEADEYSFCPNCGADMRGEQDADTEV